MKKTIVIIALAMVTALALCLAGCGDKSMSVDEMISKAKEVNISNVQETMDENPAAAREKYDGNIYKIEGEVLQISDGYFYLVQNDVGHGEIQVYLPDKELAKLTRQQDISVVGVLEIGYGSMPQLKDAHVVN